MEYRVVHLKLFLFDTKACLYVHNVAIEDVSEEAVPNGFVFDVLLVLLTFEQRKEIVIVYLLVVVHVIKIKS